MKCPKCGAALNRLTITTAADYGKDVLDNKKGAGSLQIDQCVSCNGVWFDADELNAYLDAELLVVLSPKAKDTPAYNQKGGLCPRCQKPLQQDQMKHVSIDRCAACQGIWLDGGELDKIESKRVTLKERVAYFLSLVKERFGGNRGA